MKDVKRWLPETLISILLIAAILYFVDLAPWWMPCALPIMACC